MRSRISVNILPTAKKRPRFFRRGDHVGTYNSQETEEGRFLLEAKGQITAKHQGAIRVWVAAQFPRPKSHYGSGKNSKVLKKSAPWHCLNSLDVDNICKLYLDCLNGIAWEDDKQIVELTGTKAWVDGEPFIHITIEDME